MTNRNDRETVRPEKVETGIPEYAPQSAKAIAFALDRITGGDGWWVRLTVPLNEDES